MAKSTIICSLQDLVANSGVCVKINDQQVALFYLPDESPQVYALGIGIPLVKLMYYPAALLVILSSD